MTDVRLTGVPETALWTLYHRAGAARRPNPILEDPQAIRIVEQIDYPFRRRFGPPQPPFAVRSKAFDAQIGRFLHRVPDGQVVALGEGLETQRFRVTNGRRTWLTVDLPESIATRERFIAPDERHRHLATNVLDPGWLDAVDPHRPSFISAQGLFMYLARSEVQRVLTSIAQRLPGAYLMFDAVPDWTASWTRFRLPAGPMYVPPRMRWTFDESRTDKLIDWVPTLESVSVVDYEYPRGPVRPVLRQMRAWRRLRALMPSLFLLRFGPSPNSGVSRSFPGSLQV